MPDLRIPGPFWSCLDCTLGSDGVSSDCEEDQVCFQTGDSYLCETSEFHGFTHTYMHSYLAKKIQWRRQPKNWHFPFDWNFPLISELVLAIWRVFCGRIFFPSTLAISCHDADCFPGMMFLCTACSETLAQRKSPLLLFSDLKLPLQITFPIHPSVVTVSSPIATSITASSQQALGSSEHLFLMIF